MTYFVVSIYHVFSFGLLFSPLPLICKICLIPLLLIFKFIDLIYFLKICNACL